MTDRAHPVQMNESDLFWKRFDKRADQMQIDLKALSQMGDEALLDACRSVSAVAAHFAKFDVEEFRKLYPHRVFDDKEGAK